MTMPISMDLRERAMARLAKGESVRQGAAACDHRLRSPARAGPFPRCLPLRRKQAVGDISSPGQHRDSSGVDHWARQPNAASLPQ